MTPVTLLRVTAPEATIAEVIDLSANENPLGPSPKATAAIQETLSTLHRYPPRDGTLLRDRLARRFEVAPQQLILGNGACELLEFAARAALTPGDQGVVSRPAFMPYQKVIKRCHAHLVSVPLRDGRNDLERLSAAISARTRLVILGNPNNPTGAINPSDELEAFLDQVPKQVLVVLDEAYAEYVEDPAYPQGASLLGRHSNLLVLRSLSKAYGLAGLRMGYGIASSALIERLNQQRQHYNTNALAQAAALAALEDETHLQRTLACNRAGMQQLCAGLDGLGLAYTPSQANFVLIALANAEQVVEALLARGIRTKSMAPFGLDDCLRVSIGVAEHNRRFIEALAAVLGDTPPVTPDRPAPAGTQTP